MTAKKRRQKRKTRTQIEKFAKEISRVRDPYYTKPKKPRWRAYQREAKKSATRLYNELTTFYL